MSGFAVVSTDLEHDDGGIDRRLTAAIGAFEKKGLRLTHTERGHGMVLLLFANESHDPLQVLATTDESLYCTFVGTLFYRGCTGKEATAAILADVSSGRQDFLETAVGNFCLLIGAKNELRIMADRAGLHHVYHDESLTLISNSFLASACASPTRTLRKQEILEYVQLGATFGPETLLQEIRLLDANSEILIAGRERRLSRARNPWNGSSLSGREISLEDRISHALSTCDEYYDQIARNFRVTTTAALSGGYDSRLNLALMQRHRIQPRLFVYGSDQDADVQIAKTICRSEGLEIQHVDRNAGRTLEPEQYWQNQEYVFQGLDGLTQYGFASEPYELSHRQERVAGRLLAINGGGGEIWRDFWKLPDQPMTSSEFVNAYFGGRLGGIRGGRRAESGFLANLAQKIQAIVGDKSEVMSSATVQSLYARFRLRYWQGKNNSVDNHVGYAVTPFSEVQFSVPAMWIPMSAKRNGWFERQMIQRVSPKLASYVSSYGYTFSKGPNFVTRFRTGVTSRLPTWIRALRRRTGASGPRSRYHTDRYVHARFGGGKLAIDEVVALNELRDALAFSRALTIERMMRGEWN